MTEGVGRYAPTVVDLHPTARRLRDLVEPLAANVYFAPEAIDRYRELGCNYFEGYFCSRGACLGKAPAAVITAVFAAFKPSVVERAVAGGWAKTEPEQMLDARLAGAVVSLERLVGEPTASVERATQLLERALDGVDPSGRPLYSGLSALPVPDTPWGRFWRAADRMREHRGDGHVSAWTPEVDSCEITVLSELSWGLPPRTYVFTRGYDESDVDAATARLEERSLLSNGALTDQGRALRREIEDRTDRSVREVVDRLGDDADELLALLEPMTRAVLDGGGYPIDPNLLHRGGGG